MDEQPEWHTKRSTVERQLLELRTERESLRKQEQEAQARKAEIERRASEEESALLAAADVADGANVAETSALRERMAMVKDQAEDVLVEADEREHEFAEECRHLRVDRIEAEKGLREETKKLKVFSKNIDEVETEYHEALRRQTAELQTKRQENWKRRQDLVQQTETKALEMKDELMKELQAVHDELRRAKAEIQRNVKDQVLLRQKVLNSVYQDIHNIDLAVNQGLDDAKSRARDLHQRAQEIIQEVQQRDFAMEEQLRRRVSTAITVLDMAKTAKDSASTEHAGNEQRRRHTAKAFGDVFPRSSRFDFSGLSTAKPRLQAGPDGSWDGQQTPTPSR